MNKSIVVGFGYTTVYGALNLINFTFGNKLLAWQYGIPIGIGLALLAYLLREYREVS